MPSRKPELTLNIDGFGVLGHLAHTAMTEADAVRLLVDPPADTDLTGIEFTALSTAQHNCRLPHGTMFDGVGQGREIDAAVGRAVAAYHGQPRDLLDIVVHHGHARGLRVYGGLRLNHCHLSPEHLRAAPGRGFDSPAGYRKDFRDEAFHRYLATLLGDVAEKGVDGVVLDFERKEPFFPANVVMEERFAATSAFLAMVRDTIDGVRLIARVAHDPADGEPEGQRPLDWIERGLVDVVIPATHNHEPDTLDWPTGRYVHAARDSSHPVAVWPQVWPTPGQWNGASRAGWHTPEAIRQRARVLLSAGADGVYFFNFMCGLPTTADLGPLPPGPPHWPEQACFRGLLAD